MTRKVGVLTFGFPAFKQLQVVHCLKRWFVEIFAVIQRKIKMIHVPEILIQLPLFT